MSIPSKQVIDVELDAIALSLTAFATEHGGRFVVVYVDPDGGCHECSDASDTAREYIAGYLSVPMGKPENRTTGSKH